MRALDKNITKYASIQAFAVVMIALGVLFGWLFSITLFKRPLAIWVSMNPATAIAFIFSGSSFLLLNTKIYSKTKHILASTLAGCVCFIGILQVLESIIHIELGLDSMLYAVSDDNSSAFINTMSGPAAVCFMMIGFSLFLLNMNVFPKPTVAHLLAFVTALVSLFSLLCILFEKERP